MKGKPKTIKRVSNQGRREQCRANMNGSRGPPGIPFSVALTLEPCECLIYIYTLMRQNEIKIENLASKI